MRLCGKYMVETDCNIIRRMRFACWIAEARDTHSEYGILPFHSNNGYTNASQYYILFTMPDLLRIIMFNILDTKPFIMRTHTRLPPALRDLILRLS
jgi:hypothetical protein